MEGPMGSAIGGRQLRPCLAFAARTSKLHPAHPRSHPSIHPRHVGVTSMAIKVGDKLPETTFMTMGADGAPKPITTAEAFGGKKVALFAVPGAFTPTCTKQHLPGFVANDMALKNKGLAAIYCTAVNDIFVLTAWGKEGGATGKITMLADGSADFAKKVGLDIDLSARGLGTRSKRYSMVIDDGVVTVLNVEDAPPSHEKSSATSLLACKF